MVIDAVDADTARSEDASETTRSSGESESGADELTVTVHLRASPTGAAARRQQSVLERVRELEAEGSIPDPSVERWGARVNVPASDADGSDTEAIALYEEFERAADRTGVRLEPFFESRRVVGGLLSSGPRTDRVLVFPVVSITIRRDGDLAGLYPCWVDGVHQRVENCLDAFAAGDPVSNLH